MPTAFSTPKNSICDNSEYCIQIGKRQAFALPQTGEKIPKSQDGCVKKRATGQQGNREGLPCGSIGSVRMLIQGNEGQGCLSMDLSDRGKQGNLWRESGWRGALWNLPAWHSSGNS